MCGIVGYIGKEDTTQKLINGLQRLEYRGYDSAGIAIYNNNNINIFKSTGKLENLKHLLLDKTEYTKDSTVGIGHTRWATHGIPNDINAHPHQSCDKSLALVHNGIIENYQELREDLEAKDHKFVSDTDTETLVHLVEEHYKTSASLFEAVQKSLKEVEGDFAIVVMDRNNPDKLVAAKRHAPLVIGLGKNENYLASDVPAILEHTREIIYLEDNEVAEISRTNVQVSDLDGRKIFKAVNYITWEAVTLEKMGFKHFMLKEINEQPGIVRKVLSGRIIKPELPTVLEGITLSGEDISKIIKVQIIACGTSYHAGLVGEYLIEELTGIPVKVEVASETIDKTSTIDENTLVIAVSQSGETADTRAAISIARKKKAHILVITNRIDSAMAREADSLLHVRAGIEISVAATKSFTAQLIAFYLIAIYMAEKLNSHPHHELIKIKEGLYDLSMKMELILNNCEAIKECSLKYYDTKDFIFIARGINFPIALEGALKLKEISYVHATGYQAGEMKHGPIAMLDHNMPVLAITTPGKVYKKVISNSQEAKARDARMIAVANSNDELVQSIFETIITVPEVDEILSPVLNVIPLQLLAYYIAEYLGKDVDQPRNLAKTVTVL